MLAALLLLIAGHGTPPGLSHPPSVVEKTASAPKWRLTFADDFNGRAGTAPSPSRWARDLGGGGFGNGELQSYTDGSRNAFLDGRGNLVIEARQEKTTGADGIARDYSSARLKTQGAFSQAYGRFEARIQLPIGQGIWPAFWMLGDNIKQVGWPACGEIDVMEYLGHQPNTVYGTAHGPGYSGDGAKGNKLVLPGKARLPDAFHVFSVEWEPERIRWFLDGKLYHSLTPDDIGANEWVFDQPFFIILNLAVGGHWPGPPSVSTQFPQRLVVDYVRVYRDASLKVDRAALAKRREERLRKRQEFRGVSTVRLPGTIPAADFKTGGEGVGYHDQEAQNLGGLYRPLEGVDVGLSGVPEAKHAIGWTKAGEWLAYDVDVAEEGAYTLEMAVSSEGAGGTLHVEVAGQDVTGPIAVPDTGSWQRWQVVKKTGVRLPRGKAVLRLVLDTDGPKTNSVGNVAYLRFTR